MQYLKRLRIGMKLAISAAIGVLLVTGMIVNQLRVNALTSALDTQVKSSDTLLKNILGLVLPERGEVRVLGTTPEGARGRIG